jgi:hypothetical protein
MNNQKINHFVNLLMGGLLIIIIFTFFIISNRSLPLSAAENPYPEPNTDMINFTPTENICDKWYSFFEKLPSDQQAMVQDEYQKCLEAAKTPPSLWQAKPIPNTPTPINVESSIVRRKAENGTIVETGFSLFPSFYLIKNQWYSEQNGKGISVFAGAQRSEPGGEKSFEEPLPGILIVEVIIGQKTLPDEGGVYFTPEKVGPVRIVDAEGMKLTLVAKDGTVFIFDVATRQFIPSKSASPVSRVAGAGEIIESGSAPFPSDGYDIVNYWTESNPEIGVITVMAGAQSNDPKKGSLILLLSSLENKNTIIEETIFQVPFTNNELRIAEADGEIITLVNEGGSTYKFDVSSRKFVSLPPEITEDIEEIAIINRQVFPMSGPTSTRTFPVIPRKTYTKTATLTPTRTRTPTRTPTPSPTITALPTSNPYP